VKRLDSRPRDVLRMPFELDLRQRVIADRVGASQMRVSSPAPWGTSRRSSQLADRRDASRHAGGADREPYRATVPSIHRLGAERADDLVAGLDELERHIRCVGVQRNQVLGEVGDAPPAQKRGSMWLASSRACARAMGSVRDRGDHDPLVLGVPAGMGWRAGTLKPREIRA
jgi:hypothetical protein